MISKVFIDTDVFLDTILDRKPHSVHSNRIIGLAEKNKIHGFTSSLVIANLYYILKKISTHSKAVQAINKIRSIIEVLPFTNKEISESISAEFKDFEDGVQYFIAMNNKITHIITRNVKDFKKASASIQTPKEYLQSLK